MICPENNPTNVKAGAAACQKCLEEFISQNNEVHWHVNMFESKVETTLNLVWVIWPLLEGILGNCLRYCTSRSWSTQISERNPTSKSSFRFNHIQFWYNDVYCKWFHLRFRLQNCHYFVRSVFSVYLNFTC